MTRSARQAKILELVDGDVIETQEELTRKLAEAGFAATQATISRDIKELGIIKVPFDGKRQKYVREVGERNVSGKLVNLFRHAVISVAHASNLIVIKTLAGSGNVAGMLLDRLESTDVLGCVAGDDTVIAVAKDEEAARQIHERLSITMEQ